MTCLNPDIQLRCSKGARCLECIERDGLTKPPESVVTRSGLVVSPELAREMRRFDALVREHPPTEL